MELSGTQDVYIEGCGIAGKKNKGPGYRIHIWKERLGILVQGSTQEGVDSDSVPLINTWHHVVGVAINGTVTLYVNGSKQSLTSTYLGSVSNSVPFEIGRLDQGMGPHEFEGAIDEVRVYNRALNNSEIQSLYGSNFVLPEVVSSGIEGFIHDQKTGQPLQSATVTIDGQQDFSDYNGYYKITDNFDGQYDLAVSKNGYYPVARQVSISRGDTKIENFKLTSTANVGSGIPIIINSFCDYEGVFLEGVTLENEYGVTVDWQGSTGHVEFILNGTTHLGVVSVFGATRTFDMGHDFRANSLPFGNTLEIVVVNGEGQRSEPGKFHPAVISVPGWWYSV